MINTVQIETHAVTPSKASVVPGTLGGAGFPVVHVYDIADANSANYSYVLPYAYEVLDVIVQKRGAAGGAANTVQVTTGGGLAISDAMSINIADKALARAAEIDDANSTFALGGTLQVRVVKVGGNAACFVTIIGILR